jgi:hypothetical protein
MFILLFFPLFQEEPGEVQSFPFVSRRLTSLFGARFLPIWPIVSLFVE